MHKPTSPSLVLAATSLALAFPDPRPHVLMNNCEMEAQRILIRWHDESAGYAVSPARVPLALLRGFAKAVEQFIRGDGAGVDTNLLDVAIVEGSLGFHTAPIADPVLLADLRHLSQSEKLDAISPGRRAVIERWQKTARGVRKSSFEITASMLSRPILVNATSDFRADDADQWVRVERYLRGEVEDLGGSTHANAHIRLPDGTRLKVDTDRTVLRDDKINRLYKPAMVRIAAEYNVMTREYRDARLIAFVEHDTRIDERELQRLFERGTKAWADVPDAAQWVESIRGNSA
jgi:hypothetical protein